MHFYVRLFFFLISSIVNISFFIFQKSGFYSLLSSSIIIMRCMWGGCYELSYEADIMTTIFFFIFSIVAIIFLVSSIMSLIYLSVSNTFYAYFALQKRNKIEKIQLWIVFFPNSATVIAARVQASKSSYRWFQYCYILTDCL